MVVKLNVYTSTAKLETVSVKSPEPDPENGVGVVVFNASST